MSHAQPDSRARRDNWRDGRIGDGLYGDNTRHVWMRRDYAALAALREARSILTQTEPRGYLGPLTGTLLDRNDARIAITYALAAFVESVQC